MKERWYEKSEEERDSGDITGMVDDFDAVYVEEQETSLRGAGKRRARKVTCAELLASVRERGTIRALLEHKGAVVSDSADVQSDETIEDMVGNILPGPMNRRTQEASFELLFMLHEQMVRAAASAVVPSQDVDDVSQLAFTQAWTSLRAGRYRPGNFGGWLRTITTNLAISQLRKRHVGTEVLETDLVEEADEELLDTLGYVNLDTPEGEAAADDTAGMVQRRLAHAPKNVRATFLLREVWAWDYADIAARLGVTEGRTRQLYNEARTILSEFR